MTFREKRDFSHKKIDDFYKDSTEISLQITQIGSKNTPKTFAFNMLPQISHPHSYNLIKGENSNKKKEKLEKNSSKSF